MSIQFRTLRPTSLATPLLLGAAMLLAPAAHGQTPAAARSATVADPRIGLRTGWTDAGVAAKNIKLIGHHDRSEHFVNMAQPGDFAVANSDLAFRDNLIFQGNFNGFQIWDVANPASPRLRTSVVCSGGQGDPSVYKNLLFISVEETRGRLDCGAQGVSDTVSAARFRGVRIFDISDVDHPKQVASVQTCRGSHTHTLVPDSRDPANVYIYVSGTGPVRSPNELAGCSAQAPEQDPNSSLFRIDVIKVPLAAPQNASDIGSPRIFADSASGAIAGLWKGGSHGPETQSTNVTNQCHDITVYPAIGLAAGACSGNGILLDIRDPANPKRVAEISDPNFAYWHSATFNNDGTKVLFTDEWGGGTQARCLATDKPQWGADAIFEIASNHAMKLAGYYKLPAAQTAAENCVAHNGSLVPVPGRDILVQGWYQGGLSVVDFTDSAHPMELAFFDRGPVAEKITLGGFWAAYWHNGTIVASEIARGLDIFQLMPGENLSQNEIDAAKLIRLDTLNPQLQTKIVWPARFVVARAYLDQLQRNRATNRGWATRVARDLAKAERMKGPAQRQALTRLATRLDGDAATAADSSRVRAMTAVVRELASAQR